MMSNRFPSAPTSVVRDGSFRTPSRPTASTTTPRASVASWKAAVVAMVAALGSLALVPVLAASPADAAAAPALSLPQVAAAQAGASWLDGRLTPAGYVPSSTSPGQVDFDATANVVFALASAGGYRTDALGALAYLQGHVGDYVTASGSDGPGQLALLILDAEALGSNPRSFGGTDLVARLLATQQTTGSDTGLFGSQDPTYDGTFRQGLALAGLAAAGVTTGSSIAAAASWLSAQQCSNGGWTSYVSSTNPCNGSPANYQGPDTNSSALAIQGLAAQNALSAGAAASAAHFLAKAQDKDGGWGYEPTAAHAPGFTDPDSTALVLQALLALHVSPSAGSIGRKGGGPVASLLSNQIGSGAGAGALSFPGLVGANQLATYQAVPALAGVTVAYDLAPVGITKVTPRRGPLAGGTVVTIKGSSLYPATSVHFGAMPALSVTSVSDTEVQAVSPAGSGMVDVTVTTPAGTSGVTTADRFTYRG